MRRSPAAVRPAGEAEQTEAFRVLFQQQGERLWNADRDIDWDGGAQIPDAKRASWLRLINTFHGLEVMGLDTVQVMMSQATHQLRNPSLIRNRLVRHFDGRLHPLSRRVVALPLASLLLDEFLERCRLAVAPPLDNAPEPHLLRRVDQQQPESTRGPQ